MPVQQSYDVTCGEGSGPPEPRTNKSWILPLLAFFGICVVILLVCLVWWPSGSNKSPKGSKEVNGNETESVSGVAQRPSDGEKQALIGNTATQPPTTTAGIISRDEHHGSSESKSTEPRILKPGMDTTNSGSNGTESAGSTETPKYTTSSVKTGKEEKVSDDGHDVPPGATTGHGVPDKPLEAQQTTNNNSTSTETPGAKTVHGVPDKPLEAQQTTNNNSTSTETPGAKTVHGVPDKPLEAQQTTNNNSTSTETPGAKTVHGVPDKPLEAQQTTNNNSTSTETPGAKTVHGVPDKPLEAQQTTNNNSTSTETPGAKTVHGVPDKPLEAQQTTNNNSTSTETPGAKTVHGVPDKPLEAQQTTNNNSTSTETPGAKTVHGVPDKPLEAQQTTNNNSTSTETPGAKTVHGVPDKPLEAQQTTNNNSTSTETPGAKTVHGVPDKPLEAQQTTNNNSTSTETPGAKTVHGVPDKPLEAQQTTNNNSTSTETKNSQLGSRIASRTLFYMNYSADACEDLYEYACGGFEDEHLTSEVNLAERATKRIFDQANRDGSSSQEKQFLDYYQSCVSYNNDSNRTEKIRLAKQAIAEVGKFYEETAEWNDEYFDLTDILSKLLLRDSAPLFDITPDVAVDIQETCEDQEKPARFTLKLGPSLLDGNSYEKQKEYECYNKLKSEMEKKQVDLDRLYKDYAACKNHLLNFTLSVKEALKEVSHLSDTDINDTGFTIEKELRHAFRWLNSTDDEKYISSEEIHKAYVTKAYELKKIEDLQTGLTDSAFLNWTQLLQTLGYPTTDTQQPLQVYFFQPIIEGLNELSDLPNRRTLHNAVLALYAHKIYYEFVVLPRDVESHCKTLATKLMATEASSLYMTSFPPVERGKMNAMINDTFKELKTTLESGVKNAKWLGNTDNTEIVKKIRGLKIEIPDLSYNRDKRDVEAAGHGTQAKLTGNFSEETLKLEKQNRKMMYEMLEKSPTDQNQIWTYFGLPYQTTGSAIHGLNRIVVPYGSVDWPAVWSAEKISARHLILATLGTRIASLMAQHFDSTGMKYFAGKKSQDRSAVFCSDGVGADETYKANLEDHQTYNDPNGTIDLPSTGQNVRYTITDLSLLETLRVKVGLQLAYDTMSRLPSEAESLLPWLTNQRDVLVNDNAKKQFFMAYAQMHCTSVPLTSTFVPLYEDGNLPSRLRILTVTSGNEAVGKTWSCPLGSRSRPEFIPSVFPHLRADNSDQQTIELR